MATRIVPAGPDEANLAPGTLCSFTDIHGKVRQGVVERVLRRGPRAGCLEVSVLTPRGARRFTLPPGHVRARP